MGKHRALRVVKIWNVISLIFGAALAACIGVFYLFTLFSPFFRTTLEFSAKQINIIANIGGTGQYLSVLPGIFFDKFGAKATGALCGILAASGYLLLWATLRQWIVPNFIVIGLFFALIGLGIGGAYPVALVPNLLKFPRHRGKITALISAMYGASSAIFGNVYLFGFSPHSDSFALFLGVLLGSMCLITGIIVSIDPFKKQQRRLQRRGLIQNGDEEDHDSLPKMSGTYSVTLDKIVTPDVHPFQVLKTLEFYLLFFTLAFVSGAATVIFNNLDEIASSFAGQDTPSTLYLIASSVSNFLATLAVGILFDRYQQKVSGVIFYGIASLLMCVAHLLLIFGNPQILYGVVVFAGLSSGTCWTMVGVLIGEFYGTTYFGTNYNIMLLAPFFGGFSLGYITGFFYDQEAMKEHAKMCFSDLCYRNVSMISAIACGIGVTLTGVLFFIRRRKLKEEEERLLAQATPM